MVYRTLRVYVNRNLDMTSGKKAAQAVHAALGLFKAQPKEHHRCVVLEASYTELQQEMEKNTGYLVIDSGKTEVQAGSETAFAYWQEEERDGL